ncbi:hypothetical protein HPB51_023046 [Rhipicephalus microplus]|uniref:Uncharacterized protein n=1 Tax=Rhipicephalus microplus TaxID=6941 RepID=A0A9J6DIZ3_RHIMP|nr:hypothetical protein HPB51_023046 [Rhipicephalus microplus]
MRLAFQPDEQQTSRLDSLRARLDGLIEVGSWECEDVLEHDYRMADTVDCIIYYVTGYLCRNIGKKTVCATCRDGLIKQTGFCGIPEADLVNCKTRGKLIHLNLNIYYLLKATEKEFAKQPSDNCVYNKTLDHVLLTYLFMFSCSLHKADVMAKVLHYYICMRMRQHCKQQRQKEAKKSQEMRKRSKLVRVALCFTVTFLLLPESLLQLLGLVRFQTTLSCLAAWLGYVHLESRHCHIY